MQISAIALQGMNQAQSALENTARHVARAADPTDQVDLSTEMVSLLTTRNNFDANVKTAQMGDEMEKTAIDLLA